MQKKKICLFTAHSPIVGGGGAILRSLVANLREFEINWYYIGNATAAGYEKGYLGNAVMGGPLLADITQTARMLGMGDVPRVDAIVKKLLSIECDVYWVVSHNEGLRIAQDLADHNKTVHLTVHDDWAGALCARSVRYRFMVASARQLTIKVLQSVKTVDVISAGMQYYYFKLSGCKAAVCHRYLPVNSIEVVKKNPLSKTIIVGHIGSIYASKHLFEFLELLQEYCHKKGKDFVLQLWGCHLQCKDVPQRFRNNIQLHATLPEQEIVPLLAKCDFVYSMYPLNKGLHLFSKTSLPTKLSSYLQSGRPIFGHGPADSTLAGFLSNTGLGGIWSSNNKQEGLKLLDSITGLNITKDTLEDARQKYFGETNLAVMRKALGANE
ncbi:hypothetical protein DYU05_09395 [Mucilaginibacter terrenus]|uniref:Glycosyltransferase n=1 Tax=Mucilaginibacter terrenus TaxID=2482727 RepID=A0A3E2NXX3_9SPHI|nr:hypothetical protein [Mucilaginibacter terrenus]RFZ85789.1 hypothetical protein DYU05_09395 [Mucilaginibacter terrenus]